MTSLSNNEQNIQNHSLLTIIYLPFLNYELHSSKSRQMLAELYTFQSSKVIAISHPFPKSQMRCLSLLRTLK